MQPDGDRQAHRKRHVAPMPVPASLRQAGGMQQSDLIGARDSLLQKQNALNLGEICRRSPEISRFLGLAYSELVAIKVYNSGSFPP